MADAAVWGTSHWNRNSECGQQVIRILENLSMAQLAMFLRKPAPWKFDIHSFARQHPFVLVHSRESFRNAVKREMDKIYARRVAMESSHPAIQEIIVRSVSREHSPKPFAHLRNGAVVNQNVAAAQKQPMIPNAAPSFGQSFPPVQGHKNRQCCHPFLSSHPCLQSSPACKLPESQMPWDTISGASGLEDDDNM